MKDATKYAAALTALLKKLPEGELPEFPETDDPVVVLVQSLLIEDATAARALTAYRRLREHVVDFNDLRVTMADEMAECIGVRYPQAMERCHRIRKALRQVYLREHAVSLVRLRTAGKRDVKKFFDELDGATPYAAARTMLLAFETHAVPLDEQLRVKLAAAGVIDGDAPLPEVAAWLSRQIKASYGTAAHLAFQAWVESDAGKPRSRGVPSRKAAGKSKTGRGTARTAE